LFIKNIIEFTKSCFIVKNRFYKLTLFNEHLYWK
jgi:hypothetical protein